MKITLTTDKLTLTMGPETRAAIAAWALSAKDAALEPLTVEFAVNMGEPVPAPAPTPAPEPEPEPEPTPPPEPTAGLTLWHVKDGEPVRQVQDGDEAGLVRAIVDGADRVVLVTTNDRIQLNSAPYETEVPAGPLQVEARAGAKLGLMKGIAPIRVTLV